MVTPVFDYAVKYFVKATCKTPFRTGGEGRDIARDTEATPILYGTSLAGTLRTASEMTDPGMTNRLFGSVDNAGVLTVSDAVFSRTTECDRRVRVRISETTGAAKDGNLFDISYVPEGAVFSFVLTLKTLGRQSGMEKQIEAALAQLHSGNICLGAQKTNGFGRVSLCVEKRVFDLCGSEKDREDWLERKDGGARLTLPEVRQQGIRMTLSCRVSGMLVKSGKTERMNFDNGKSRAVIVGIKDQSGNMIMPGSSLKGLLRSRVYRIQTLLGLAPDTYKRLFGSSPEDKEHSPGLVSCYDTVVQNGEAQENQRITTRIRINRFTGGVMDRHLFSEQLTDGLANITVTMPDEPALAYLVLLALRDMALGDIAVGSGGSVGHGVVSGETIEISSPAVGHARVDFQPEMRITEGGELIESWQRAMEGLPHEM